MPNYGEMPYSVQDMKVYPFNGPYYHYLFVTMEVRGTLRATLT